MIKKKIYILLILCLLLEPQFGCLSQEMPVPVSVQMPIFMKIFHFDRNLIRNGSNQLTILVLYQGNNRTSLNVKNNILELVENNDYRNLRGFPVTFSSYEYKTPKDLENAITKSNANVIYLTPMRAIDISAVSEVCREKKVLSATGVADWVQGGISTGIDTKGDKPLILINLKAAKAEGSDFSSQLLKLSKVIN